MSSPFYDPASLIASHVDAYRRTGDLGTLFDQLKALAKTSLPDALKAAAQPYQRLT